MDQSLKVLFFFFFLLLQQHNHAEIKITAVLRHIINTVCLVCFVRPLIDNPGAAETIPDVQRLKKEP